MKPRLPKPSVFTLVEVLSALAIVAVLIAILFPVVASSRRRAQTAVCLSNVRQWGSAVIAYSQDYDGNYPAAVTGDFVGETTPGGGGGESLNIGTLWYDAVHPYQKIFLRCPLRIVSEAQQYEEYNCGYALNISLNVAHTNAGTKHYTGDNETVQQYQSTVVTVLDSRPGIVALSVPDSGTSTGGIYPSAMKDEINAQKPAAFRHDGGANYAFADGHAKWLRDTAFRYQCDGTHPCFKP